MNAEATTPATTAAAVVPEESESCDPDGTGTTIGTIIPCWVAPKPAFDSLTGADTGSTANRLIGFGGLGASAGCVAQPSTVSRPAASAQTIAPRSTRRRHTSLHVLVGFMARGTLRCARPLRNHMDMAASRSVMPVPRRGDASLVRSSCPIMSREFASPNEAPRQRISLHSQVSRNAIHPYAG